MCWSHSVEWRPHLESNQELTLRKGSLYPFNYGAVGGEIKPKPVTLQPFFPPSHNKSAVALFWPLMYTSVTFRYF